VTHLGEGPGAPLIWGKKEFTEGRKVGRASKTSKTKRSKMSEAMKELTLHTA